MLHDLDFFLKYKKGIYTINFKDVGFKQNIGCIILYSNPDPIEYFKPHPRLSRLPRTSDGALILSLPLEHEISWHQHYVLNWIKGWKHENAPTGQNYFYFYCYFNVESMRTLYFLYFNFSHTKESSLEQRSSFQRAPVWKEYFLSLYSNKWAKSHGNLL